MMGSQDPWADLATQVAEQSRAHRLLASDVSEIGADLDKRLTAHAEKLDGLAQQITELLEAMPEKHTPQVDWRTLDDQQRHDAWAELYDWAHDTLGGIYRVTRGQLHDCWPDHPAIRNHLSWLRVAFEQAVAPTASPSALAEWHVNYLPRALEQVRSLLGQAGCGVAMHHGTPTGTVAGPDITATEKAVIDRANWADLDTGTPDDQEGQPS